jgi:hypothetical protein
MLGDEQELLGYKGFDLMLVSNILVVTHLFPLCDGEWLCL